MYVVQLVMQLDLQATPPRSSRPLNHMFAMESKAEEAQLLAESASKQRADEQHKQAAQQADVLATGQDSNKQEHARQHRSLLHALLHRLRR